MGFEDVGLPGGSTVCDLFYSEPAQTIVAHVRLQSGPFEVQRIYSKSITQEHYSLLGPVAGDQSHAYPVLCPLTPSLYYLSSLLERFGDGVGGWIQGVFHRDLASGAVRSLVQYEVRKELDVWVSSLNSVSRDGTSLFCAAAFAEPVADGRRVHYHLCSMDIATGALTRIAPLKGVFA